MSLILRHAGPDDADRIADIRVAAWRSAYGRFMPEAYLDSLDPLPTAQALREKLPASGEGFHATVAERDKDIIGFVLTGPPRYETGDNVIELWALNVMPSAWRHGAGRALTLHANEWGRLHGNSTIELWCIRDNVPAQTTYERCGFTLDGRTRTSNDLTGHPLHERLYAKKL